MKSVWNVVKEQLCNLYLIQRLALYQMKTENSGNYLGLLWEIINPLIQITVYWFVFGGLFKGHLRQGVGNIPYLPWMLSAITVWFFINQSILLGSKSIYTRISFIAKMNFPMSTIPTFVIVAKFYQHLVVLVIIIIMLSFYGYPPSVYYFQLPYYMLATIIFLLGLSLITSTLSTIIRDVHLVIASIMRMLIYFSPFLWVPTPSLEKVMKFNPIYYLAEGYRYTLLGKQWYFIEHGPYTLYFWGVTLLLFAIGSILHVKFRNHFVDYL